jgi:hypothetical protein
MPGPPNPYTPWWPQHWDAPTDPKVQEVALVGHEDYYVIGVFVFVWDARRAAARALLAYRRYRRGEGFEDEPHRPRGNDLRAQITSRKVDEYIAPRWDRQAASP